jgi:hypothetical protein
MNFKVGRRYRGGKPRIYLPWGSASDQATLNQWTSGFISSAATAWTNFITAIAAAPWSGASGLKQVNVSFYSGFTNETGPSGRARAVSTPRAGSAVVDDIIAHSLNTIYGVQRSRLARPR